MIIRKQAELRYSDITPKDVYLNRRRFLGASVALIGAVAAPHSASAVPTKLNAIKAPAQFSVTDKETPLATIAGYNNFYEFGTGKEDPSHNAPKWHVPDLWSVSIEGPGADKPQTRSASTVTAAREYGFYSNVNPDVERPRWSQATERQLGELTKRKTVKFNGYGDRVAGLYASLDLRKTYLST
jgi:DMSO/TMAO reductase YedYZ molybdopterin-dependent catalytic subunit